MYQVLSTSSSWFASVALFVLSSSVANASLFIGNDVGDLEILLGTWLLHQKKKGWSSISFQGLEFCLLSPWMLQFSLDVYHFDFQRLLSLFWLMILLSRFSRSWFLAVKSVQNITSKDVIIIRQILAFSKVLTYKES